MTPRRVTQRRPTRRAFLAGTAAATVAWPFLSPRLARAAAPPKRFLAVFTPCGVIPEVWTPTGGGRDFTLPRILAPLEPFKSRLLVLRGLDMSCTNIGPGGAHQRGAGAFLTGRPLNPGSFSGQGGDIASGWAGGISIDQRIANAIGGETTRKSLEVGVQVEGSNNRHRIAYAGSDRPLAPQNSPYRLFESVFGEIGLTADELARRLRRRQSMLDHVSGDLAALRARLGAGDGVRLDAHLEALRELERRLSAGSGACEVPSVGDPINHNARVNYRAIGELQMSLITRAFACDITRVSTLLWSGATSGQSFPDLGFTERHHALTHRPRSEASSREKIIKINVWYAQRFRYLLQQLDSVVESDGSTLLDNTVVFWGSAVADGRTHSRNNMPFIVAGGGGGALTTGRFHTYRGRSHNDLLSSLATAVGVPTERFGDRNYTDRPVANILA